MIWLLLAASLAVSREPPVVLDPRLERFLAAPQLWASAPAAFRVGVWEVMSRGRRPRVGVRRRRALMLPIL